MSEEEAPHIHPAQLALFRAVEYVHACGVHGDLVEFGCYLGQTAGFLAHALRDVGAELNYSDEAHRIKERRLWVFDSFEGFPEATDPVDIDTPHIKAGVWYAGQPAGGSPDAVRAKCAQFIATERISVIKGWYKDTLSQLPEGQKFAVVHVDCDYYESTSQVLNHLFANNMVSDGCTILFDDWYCNRGSPEFGEQRAWNEAVKRYGVRFSDWGPYGATCRRLIVHAGAAA